MSLADGAAWEKEYPSENFMVRPGTQLKWDMRFLALSKLVSSWSKDPSTKTGAVIVRNRVDIVSVGFNGFPQRMNDASEYYANREDKYSRIVHCEINAAIFARQSVEGCTLYTWPFASCDRCCVQMAQHGIKRMVAPEPTAETIARWGNAWEKTRKYCAEMGIELVEYSWKLIESEI